MHDRDSREGGQSHAHPVQEVLQELQVRPQGVIEVTMVHHVDALALVKLSLHLEHELVHRPALDQLVDEPEIFLIVNRVLHHADVVLLFLRCILLEELRHLKLYVGRRVELVACASRELLHSEAPSIFLAEPDHGDASPKQMTIKVQEI